MMRSIRGRVIHVQGAVTKVVVRQSLSVHHGIVYVRQSLLLTPRREPHQRLPKNGQNQKGGLGSSRHGFLF